ncbi:MAG TPA: glycine cleavage system aminomethyltransferase GcvT [Ktedonobacteraceae bacterium]|nr:glycine cleavage system aminomethyltransferase GcvT [Ktedonobacteraceae bacterium]
MTVQDTAAASFKRTPLYEEHRALGARLVEFSGWEMPVQYSSILEEHRAVRTRAGLFDVSHMGEFKVEGPDALAYLQYLVPNDVSRLAIHQALYTQLCLPDAGTIDDLLVYRLGENQYMLVVNAGNIDKDFAWAEQQSRNFDITLVNQSDVTALLALQGPEAQAILQPLTGVDLTSIRYYHFEPGKVDGIDCLISRTGYTGEDGFELYCTSIDVVKLWRDLLAAGKERGLLPAGLGARDTLRLEAAYCLYGHELDEATNPLEAGLGWTIKLNKGEFLAHDALVKIKEQGVKRKLVGIEMVDRGVCRGGYAIYEDGEQIGVLTSGAPAPTLNKNIGMGYVAAARAIPGNTVSIDIRGKQTAARIVALPFYKRQK